MIWVGVLLAALITVPVSVKIHDENTMTAQNDEVVAIAAMTEYENANNWCDPTVDE